MENFDAESSLKFIEKYSVSMSQWVPTMFVKMFKLPEDIRKNITYHLINVRSMLQHLVQLK